MKLKSAATAAVMLAVMMSAFAEPDPGAQSDANFRAALADRTTSPYYVRIILIDPETETRQVVCTEAPSLLGSIVREFDLQRDPAGFSQAEEIAIAAPDHAFRFTKPDARANALARDPGDATRSLEACNAIGHSFAVRRGDRSGAVMIQR